MRIICSLLLFCALAVAQDFRATISGVVTDQSGAAIPGAKVKVTQNNTNEAKEIQTNQDGYFSIPFLQPSTYHVEVTAEGFQKLRRENLSLAVAEKLDLPFKLQVGQMSQEVTVSAEITEVLQTADAGNGLSFDSLMTSEYALNGRQVYMLLDLTPGVLFGQEEFGATGYSGTRGWDVNDNFAMNGGVKGTNMFTLNGAPITQTGMFQLAPNVDAIQEFKVSTNQYDASVGRTGGGAVNTMIKSGSNQWHGTLFNFMRNTLLDANFTQNNAVGAPRGKRITNQFGGTLGGKIRKDKDFIFVSFEGFRERVPFPTVSDVPTLDVRGGQNFAAHGINIYDPLTVHPCVSGKEPGLTGNCDSSGYIRDAFPNMAVPLSRQNPIGQKLLSYFPAPNYIGDADNFVNSGNTGKYRYDQPMARWDRVIDSNNRLYTLVTFQTGTEYRNQGVSGPAAYGNMHTWRKNFNIITSWTRVLGPSAIFDLRASFGRFWQQFPNTDKESGVTAETLGMTGMIHAPTSTSTNPPRIQIANYTNTWGNDANMQTFRAENVTNLAPSVVITSGTKTLKFGVDMVYNGRAQADIGLANGSLNFNRWSTWRYSKRTSALNATDGSGIADLLLGSPGAGQIDWNDTYYRTWPYLGFYVQDDWKVRRNLTLNIGLRWDVQFPWVERWNRANSGFDYNSVNPLSDQILARWRDLKTAYDKANPTRYPYPDPPKAILGGKTFVDPNGNRRIYNFDWSNIQPRFGLAWQIGRKTVLRTGFGMVHRTPSQFGQTDGFSQTTNYTRSLDGDIFPSAKATGPYSLQNPFPDGISAPTGSALGLLTNVGNAMTYSSRNRPIPRTFQYSFGLQRRIFWDARLNASYVGSYTNHEAVPINTDYWPYEFNQAAFGTNSIGNTSLQNPFYGIVPSNRTRGSSTTIARQELFRAYPLFANITNDINPWGWYRYDSLQLSLDKRFSGNRSFVGGLTLVFSYTFSKNLQQMNYLNTWNFNHEKPVKELVSYDKPQNLSVSGVWDLPMGKGRRFLIDTNKVVDGVLGGWTMNWAYKYSSGNPIGGINAVNTCGYLLVDDQQLNRWYNNDKSCWKGNPSYTIRSVEDRYAWLRQMEISTMNLALAKTFRMTERFSFQLRGEAFNLQNRPIYRPPVSTYTDARFGIHSIEQQNFPRNVQVSLKLKF
jgi:hypothetical protein